MAQVFEVVRDRDDVSDEHLLALTDDDVEGLYIGWIEPALDNIESSLLGNLD